MAYKQNSFSVNIYVRGVGVSGGTGTGEAVADIEDAKLTDEEREEQNRSRKKAGMAKVAVNNMKQQSIAALKQIIYGGAQYYVSGIGMTTGDQFVQAVAQKSLDNTMLGISMMSGAIHGAKAGSALGPIGAIGGAVLGMISPAISRGMEYGTGLRNYNFTVWKNSSNVNYARSRAELTDTAGRSRIR